MTKRQCQKCGRDLSRHDHAEGCDAPGAKRPRIDSLDQIKSRPVRPSGGVKLAS